MTITLTSQQFHAITKDNLENINRFIQRMDQHSWTQFFGLGENSYDKSRSSYSWVGYYAEIMNGRSIDVIDTNLIKVQLGVTFYTKASFRTFNRFDSFKLFCQEFISTYLACKGSQVYGDTNAQTAHIVDHEAQEFMDMVKRRGVTPNERMSVETFGGPIPDYRRVGSTVETLPQGQTLRDFEHLDAKMSDIADSRFIIAPVKLFSKKDFDTIRNDMLSFIRELNEQLEKAAYNMNSNLVATVLPQNVKFAEKIVKWFAAAGFDVVYDKPKNDNDGGRLVFKFN